MRQIKFRAWDGKKMHYDGNMLYDSKTSKMWFGDCGSWRDSDIIMQYTGLSDKNGKEIWEGDILQFTHMKIAKPFQVYWNDTKAGFCDWSPKDKAEIIGNIYQDNHLIVDNPEDA